MASGISPRPSTELPVSATACAMAHKHEEKRVMSQESRKPDREFRAGRVAASLWRTEIERDGQTVLQWSTKIKKSYHDDTSDCWKFTDYYYPSELSDLLIVTRHALDFIRLEGGAHKDVEQSAAPAADVSV